MNKVCAIPGILPRCRSWGRCAWLIAVLLLAAGCKQDQKCTGPVYQNHPEGGPEVIYHFAIHPLHNPAKLAEVYQPLLDNLNAQLAGVRLEVEGSRDYARFEKKIAERKPEVILPNPWQTLGAMEAGYNVVAMAGDPDDFKGIIIIRKDSGIMQPADLKGRSISYPSSTALAACIMPQMYLHDHGVAILTDIDNRYVGSQESSIMNVYLKLTTAGATWPLPWRAFLREHPEEAAELKVAWETEPLVNNSVMIRNDLPRNVQDAIVNYLIHLQQTTNGCAILEKIGIDKFRPASNSDYDLVRKYVTEFEGKVRKIAN